MDLLEALRVIKDECDKHLECYTCPMRDVDEAECTLGKIDPCNWGFIDEEVAPRLFV